jgi:hypothetical protein
VPSASSQSRLFARSLARVATLAVCAALIVAAVTGCETTQDKAAKQQARAAHILRERAKRQKEKKKAHNKSKKHHEEGKK